MRYLIAEYDDIFLNQFRICSLINKFNQEKQHNKLNILGKLVSGYIYYRGYDIPNSSPMSMQIILEETINSDIIEDIFHELSLENGFCINYAKHRTYISLY